MSRSRVAMWGACLALTAAHLAVAGCDSGENGEDPARHRLVTDADLACLAAYGRDRDCFGEAAAGPVDVACPPDYYGEQYDVYGAECLRAHIAEWECHAELECSETTGCEAEDEAVDSTCTLVVDGG